MLNTKKIFCFLIFIFFLSQNTLAGVTTGYKFGKGELKITDEMANVLEFFFSGGTRGIYKEKQKISWKPALIAISVDGSDYSYFRHPFNVTRIDSKNYAQIAINQCEKKSGQECYLFANGYKIVWDNGTDKKKRKLKRKDIKAGKTLDLLIELGFYGNNISSNKKTYKIRKEKESNNSKSNDDIVQKLKDLKKLYDEGVLNKEEFTKAKKKLLN